MEEEKVIGILREIGLGKVEIDVYLDLLRGRLGTPTEIAERTKYHRPNVYDALKRLGQRGFIRASTNGNGGNKKIFQANPPSFIVSYMQQKNSELRDVVPFLESIANSKVSQQNVSVSYGVTRARQAISSILDIKKDILIWGVPSNIEDVFGSYFFDEIMKERIKKKMHSKILYSYFSKELRKAATNPFQEIRYLENSGNQTAMTVVSGDNVIIISHLDNPVMIIEMSGANVANWFSGEFQKIWDIANKPSVLKYKVDSFWEKSKSVVKKHTTLMKKIGKKLSRLEKSNKR